MQITGGWARGRRLKVPRGHNTRPTPARVREALFSMLGEALQGARVLDLFAGSGALGLEALSRGAAHVTLVEPRGPALRALEENVSLFAQHPNVLADDQALQIWPMDAQRALSKSAGKAWDIVFLDPPYASGLWQPCLEGLRKGGLLSDRAYVVCEHPTRDAPTLSLEPGGTLWRCKSYGDVSLSVFVYDKPES